MTKSEFMYDYSLEYIVFMINRYIEENFNHEETQQEEVKEMNFSKLLQEVKICRDIWIKSVSY